MHHHVVIVVLILNNEVNATAPIKAIKIEMQK
jgi:hypothetical protein